MSYETIKNEIVEDATPVSNWDPDLFQVETFARSMVIWLQSMPSELITWALWCIFNPRCFARNDNRAVHIDADLDTDRVTKSPVPHIHPALETSDFQALEAALTANILITIAVECTARVIDCAATRTLPSMQMELSTALFCTLRPLIG